MTAADAVPVVGCYRAAKCYAAAKSDAMRRNAGTRRLLQSPRARPAKPSLPQQPRKALGVSIRFGCSVKDLLVEGGRAAGVVLSGKRPL
jgi:hypothetical protein